MSLTADRVAALAPDAASAKNGRQIAGTAAKWASRGRGGSAVWGEFRGSGKTPYQIRADLSDAAAGVAWKCSCPSRKQPCKHASLACCSSPPSSPIRCRRGTRRTGSRSGCRSGNRPPKRRRRRPPPRDTTADPAARAKRRAKRETKIAAGLDQLDLWLEDLVRNGAGLRGGGRVESDGGEFERQAARLVDAQATGLASRLRGLAEQPGSRRGHGPTGCWPGWANSAC